MGKWTGSTMFMNLLGSQTSGGTYYSLPTNNSVSQQTIAIAGSDEYHLYASIENVPNFIKLYNNSGGAKTLELDYIGFSN